MSDDVWQIVPPILIVVGLCGMVVPIFPGMPVVLAGMLVFALGVNSPLGWVIFALALAVAAAGMAAQYLVPGRRMSRQGVPTSTLLIAVVAAIIGFFVIPVIGAIVGFVGAIWVVELLRSREARTAWTRTKHAVTAVLQSMGIELLAGLLIAVLYVVGVLAT